MDQHLNSNPSMTTGLIGATILLSTSIVQGDCSWDSRSRLERPPIAHRASIERGTRCPRTLKNPSRARVLRRFLGH
ncbi:hypothetical protein PM082_007502 [Marasmius tenuissimus]|nr:hypothetical protein PM082_007502 [Marasmius tenuissimus]